MIRFGFVVLGVILCLLGAQQVQEGIPGFYLSRGIADLQGDANDILLGIAWMLGGIASGIFALAFPASDGLAAWFAGRNRPGAGKVSPAPSDD